jgi:hypothetical protein
MACNASVNIDIFCPTQAKCSASFGENAAQVNRWQRDRTVTGTCPLRWSRTGISHAPAVASVFKAR